MLLNQTTYVDRYYRRWQGPFFFTPPEIARVPPQMLGVYQLIFRGKEREIAYIGIATSVTIKRRLTLHFQKKGNRAVSLLSLPYDLDFAYYECDSQTATQIESHVVSDAKPPFNVRPEYRNYIASIMMH